MAKERDPGVDRIIAFSDGVVAIAITLLILPFTEIDRAERCHPGQRNRRQSNRTVRVWLVLRRDRQLLDDSPLDLAATAAAQPGPHPAQPNMACPDRLPTFSHRADRRRPQRRVRHALYRRLTRRLHSQSSITPNSPMARQLLKAAATSRQAGSALPPWWSPWSSRSSRLRPGSGLCYCSFRHKSSLDDCPIRRPQSQP